MRPDKYLEEFHVIIQLSILYRSLNQLLIRADIEIKISQLKFKYTNSFYQLSGLSFPINRIKR